MTVTRFSLGDRVWFATSRHGPVLETCPDCLGSAHWHCVLPNGEEFDVECPRCYPGGYLPSTGVIRERYEVTPYVKEFVITGVEIQQDKIEYRSSDYMTAEENLFVNETKAVARANELASETRVRLEKEAVDQGMRKGRPKRTRDGKHEANGSDDPTSSANYARHQVRAALKEVDRWVKFAAQHGTVIQIDQMIAKEVLSVGVKS